MGHMQTCTGFIFCVNLTWLITLNTPGLWQPRTRRFIFENCVSDRQKGVFDCEIDYHRIQI